MKGRSFLDRSLLVAFGCVGLFLLLFLPLPLHGLLPGNTDTLLAIALSNLSLERLHLWLGGAPAFTAMYPARDVMAYGENCYGLVLLFEALKLMLRSDLWAYYAFISILFGLNAFAIFKLAGLFVDDRKIALLAGIVFGTLGFVFANVDDPNIVFLFFPILALYLAERAIRERHARLLVWGAAVAGLQIWFGFYDFVYLFIALAIYGAFQWRALAELLGLRELVRVSAAYALPALPLLALYAYDHRHADIYSPYNLRITMANASLGWNNFWNVLPHNLIYSDSHNIYGALDVGGWHRTRKNGFLGFVFPLCALLGAVCSGKRTRAFLAIFVSFFVLGFGVHLPFFEKLMELPLTGYLRIPLRFLLVALIPASLYFAVGVAAIRDAARRSLGGKAALVCALLASVGLPAMAIAENLTAPLNGFELGTALSPPASYVEYFSKFPKPQVVLDLPSTCFYFPEDHANEFARLWFYNRDILYMNWQTYHRQIIVDGVNSYVPGIRAALDGEFQRVPAPAALAKLREAGVRDIVFHKKMVLVPRENILESLKHSPGLVERLENDDIAIFEISA